MIELAQTGYTWESITANKNVDIQGLTSLVIYNRGEVPFKICGQIIAQGEQYRFLSDGTTSNFKEQLNFINGVPGSRLAILEKRWVIDNTPPPPPPANVPPPTTPVLPPNFLYNVEKMYDSGSVSGIDFEIEFTYGSNNGTVLKTNLPQGESFKLEIEKIDVPTDYVEVLVHNNYYPLVLAGQVNQIPAFMVFQHNIAFYSVGLFKIKVILASGLIIEKHYNIQLNYN